MWTGGAYRPFLHDRHFSAASGSAYHGGRRIASSGRLARGLRLRAMPLEFEVRNDLRALPVRSMCKLYSITRNQIARMLMA